jgi:hypothetical protein
MHLMLYASAAIAKVTRISGPGRHIGGKNVVGVTVEVLAGPVVAHRGPGISVPGSDLDIAQVHPGIQTGRERFTNSVEYLSSQDGAMRLLPSSLPL